MVWYIAIAVSIGSDSSVLIREAMPAMRAAAGLGVGVGLDDAEHPLLVRPDDAPDVQEHDDAEVDADAHQGKAGLRAAGAGFARPKVKTLAA